VKYFHFCGYNLLSAGAETPVFSGVMRCKTDVASPTGCRAASCRFLSFSVVFLPFRPAFPAVRSSCLPRRPLLLSSPPSAPPVFSADRSSLFPRALPLRLIILLCALPKCALPGTAPFRVLSFASPAPLPSRASSLSRLFPLAPCPCPFRAPFPPPRNIFFCYRTNGIRNISVNLSRKNPQSNRFQLKYLKINSYDFD
jgi:hypothetical protein